MKIAKRYITEIMSDIQNDVTNIQHYLTNTTVRAVFDQAYNPEKKWILPEGNPPYRPAPEPLGMTPTNFMMQVRIWPNFRRTDLTPLKREMMFVNLLEGIHDSEALLLLAIKNGDLSKLYPFATKEFAQEHGFIQAPPEVVAVVSNKYTFFWGNNPFSNWHPSNFKYKGMMFCSSEQAMMWEKALMFNDILAASMIMATKDPKEQKAIGRKIRGYDEELWSVDRAGIVYNILLEKFSQNPDLLKALKDTGETELVEASPIDKIWGIGLAADDPKAQDKNTWNGLNLLGRVLTAVRTQLTK